jgi:Flp pilus assembly CpaF family ATPase
MALHTERNKLIVLWRHSQRKDQFLNACSIFFPANRRVISIEETRELELPNFIQWIAMVTREPNPEGKGESNNVQAHGKRIEAKT